MPHIIVLHVSGLTSYYVFDERYWDSESRDMVLTSRCSLRIMPCKLEQSGKGVDRSSLPPSRSLIIGSIWISSQTWSRVVTITNQYGSSTACYFNVFGYETPVTSTIPRCPSFPSRHEEASTGQGRVNDPGDGKPVLRLQENKSPQLEATGSTFTTLPRISRRVLSYPLKSRIFKSSEECVDNWP